MYSLEDKIDYNRAEVWIMMYLTASVHNGVVKMRPDVHGIYETYDAAEQARKDKSQPDNYFVQIGRYRIAG